MKMTESKVTIKVVLDRRSKKKGTNKFPLKIRVNYKRDRQYISLHEDLTEAEWEDIQNKNVRGRLKDIQHKMESYKVKAQSIVDSMQTFNFNAFKKLFGISAAARTLEWYFVAYIDNLKAEKRIRTAQSYQTALNELKGFYKGKFAFHHLNASELLRFEDAFIDKGKSISTVGVYMRSLRTIYNVALEEGTISKADYPFSKKRYNIPTTKKRKLGIDVSYIKQIHSFELENPVHQFYRDLWMFSFHCNGMNLKDIAYLTYQDVSNGLLSFTRKKSEKTKKSNNEKISISLNKNALEILERWGDDDKKKTNYIFPILNKSMDLETQIKTYQQVNQMINKVVKNIAEINKWPFHVTYLTARHSYGNLLQKSDQPLHVIQKALGHSDPKTTQHYLNDLQVDKLEELSSLTEF